MPKVLVNGLQFHYQTRGEGPELVLIHGVTSSLAVWYNGTLPTLTPHYHVTAYDLRGHGLSQATPTGYNSLAMANDLTALLDTLGIEKTLLMGHSYGGAIALHYALLHPERVRGIVLLDSGLACLRHLRMIEDWIGWKIQPDLASRGFTLEWFLDQDSKDDMTEFLRKGLSTPRIAGFKRSTGGLSPRARKLVDETTVGIEFREVAGLTIEALKEVSVPVLALFGGVSPNRKMASFLAQTMPNCCEVLLEGRGHFAAVHDPESVIPEVLPFLADPEGFVLRAKARNVITGPEFAPPMVVTGV